MAYCRNISEMADEIRVLTFTLCCYFLLRIQYTPEPCISYLVNHAQFVLNQISNFKKLFFFNSFSHRADAILNFKPMK